MLVVHGACYAICHGLDGSSELRERPSPWHAFAIFAAPAGKPLLTRIRLGDSTQQGREWHFREYFVHYHFRRSGSLHRFLHDITQYPACLRQMTQL